MANFGAALRLIGRKKIVRFFYVSEMGNYKTLKVFYIENLCEYDFNINTCIFIEQIKLFAIQL